MSGRLPSGDSTCNALAMGPGDVTVAVSVTTGVVDPAVSGAAAV